MSQVTDLCCSSQFGVESYILFEQMTFFEPNSSMNFLNIQSQNVGTVQDFRNEAHTFPCLLDWE